MSGGPVVLGIETSTALLGVAVAAGGSLLSEDAVNMPMAGSSILLPMVDAVLKKAGVPASGLDAVAVSVGPGSFTGLRIGCATAQGLAHALGKPVVAVPTFRALVEQALATGAQSGSRTKIAVVQGKAKAQTVTALYGDAGEEILTPSSRTIEEFAGEIGALAVGPVAVTGDAGELLTSFCKSQEGERPAHIELTLVAESARLPLPRTIAFIGAGMFSQGLGLPPEAAIPRYLRKAQVVMSRKRHTLG